jgi:hypothetical protein
MNAKTDANLTSIFFPFFSVIDLWKLEKLEDVEGSGRNPGYIEPYIVPSQQSTNANAFIDQS